MPLKLSEPSLRKERLCLVSDIYVIVRNQSTPSGDDTIEELCREQGYFISETTAEQVCERLNKVFVERMRDEALPDSPDEDVLEEWETHYGYIPLSMNSFNRG